MLSHFIFITIFRIRNYCYHHNHLQTDILKDEKSKIAHAHTASRWQSSHLPLPSTLGIQSSMIFTLLNPVGFSHLHLIWASSGIWIIVYVLLEVFFLHLLTVRKAYTPHFPASGHSPSPRWYFLISPGLSSGLLFPIFLIDWVISCSFKTCSTISRQMAPHIGIWSSLDSGPPPDLAFFCFFLYLAR